MSKRLGVYPFCVAFTLLFVVLITVLSVLLNVDIGWFSPLRHSMGEFQEFFPNYPGLAFLLLIVGVNLYLLCILLFNFYLYYADKDEYVKTYLRYMPVLFVTVCISCILLINTFDAVQNRIHIYLLIFFIAIYLFAFFAKQNVNPNFQLIFLMVLGGALRLTYLLNNGDFDSQEDSLARIAQIYDWKRDGGIPGGLIWLPAHHWLIYALGELFSTSYEFAGRLLSFICSVALIPVGYNLIKLLFNSNIAFLSILFYCLNAYFIRFSTIQMTEIPFLFFFVSGIHLCLLYFKNKKILYFVFSCILITIATLIRFEAWIILPLFTLIFWIEKRDLRTVIYWTIFSSLGIIICSVLLYIVHSDPIFGVTASDIEVREDLKNVTKIQNLTQLKYNPWVPLYFIPLIIIGLIGAIKENKNRYLAASLLLLTIYYIFKVYSLTLMPFWRYYTFIIFFTIPFLFYFLNRKIHIQWLTFLFIAVYTVRSAEDSKIAYNMPVPLEKGFFDSARYFKEKLLNNDNTKLIMSVDPYSTIVLWEIYSGTNGKKDIFYDIIPSRNGFETKKKFNTDNISTKIIREGYNVILIQEGYEINSVFESDPIKAFLIDHKVDTLLFDGFTMITIDQDLQ